jgi:aryl-alcohol dehydrogenase-like predicted oxidoreductase
VNDETEIPALDRRQALKLMATGVLIGASGVAYSQNSQGTLGKSVRGITDSMPMVRLGRSGPKVSRICLGGWHLGEAIKKADDAIKLIERSRELGVNFFDSAHSYGRGESEKRYRRAFAGSWHEVVIMTKSTQRSAAAAEREIDESLSRMGCPHIDLWQFHSINSEDDARRIAGSGGAVEAARKALADGRIKMVGATGHNSPEGLALLLELIPEIEVCQFPVNAVDLHWKSFLKTTLPVAQKHKVGVLAMKTVAMGRLIGKAELTVKEAHRYALSQPIDVWVSGVETIAQLEENVQLVCDPQPMNSRQMAELVNRTEPLKGPGTEMYKNW